MLLRSMRCVGLIASAASFLQTSPRAQVAGNSTIRWITNLAAPAEYTHLQDGVNVG
jgi:hypothetical protein